MPSFPGLCFSDGCGFKQWTGDDSKALMKVCSRLFYVYLLALLTTMYSLQVFLPAISGHVPSQMVHMISAFMEFWYPVCRSVVNEADLDAIDHAVARFHQEHEAFELVWPAGFSLPQQHAMVHYHHLIEEFGAPNGLCSSITESKHIKAIKQPWWHSSCFEAMGQMLVTNQCIDKVSAAHIDFIACRMLDGPILSEAVIPIVPTVDSGETEEVDGPHVKNTVVLAVKRHQLFHPINVLYWISLSLWISTVSTSTWSQHQPTSTFWTDQAVPFWSIASPCCHPRGRCPSLKLSIHSWTHICLSLSCHYILCTKWPVRNGWNASRMNSSCSFLATQSSSKWLCVHRDRFR